MLTHMEAQRLAQEAVTALTRGDGQSAYAVLAPFRDGVGGIVPPWLLMAQAAQTTGNDREAEAALGHFLAGEPRHLGALLLMATVKARLADDRGAETFYRTALAVAAQFRDQVTSATVPLLQAGERFLAETAGRFALHLETAVDDAGLARGRGGRRVGEAIDLLLGRQEVFLQHPTMFYFPGLAQRAFFERDEFDWLPELEAAAPIMRSECAAAMTAGSGFAPYVQSTADRPPPANPLRDDASWSAYHLWRGGEPVAAGAAACPATMAALERVPMPVIAKRSPMAIYSVLQPGTHIRPHHGLLNTRLICHLPLFAPEGCGLRVGGETRHWREHETLIFDDSFEHEAWNRGDSTRVVLLFEIWRPDITPDERAALTTIFEAIDTYRGVVTDTG